jgi:general stress protein 26
MPVFGWQPQAPKDGPHLTPLAFVWDGSRLFTATQEDAPTARNLRWNPRARLALGAFHDVVIIEAKANALYPEEVETTVADAYAAVSLDAHNLPGYVFLELTPRRILSWRFMNEFDDRTLMRNGQWLV